jgi:hypothetical protein
MISADDFHRVADAIPHDEEAAMQQFGCEPNAIEQFVREAVFRDPETEAVIPLEPLSLVMGISVGLLAARADALREKDPA